MKSRSFGVARPDLCRAYIYADWIGSGVIYTATLDYNKGSGLGRAFRSVANMNANKKYICVKAETILGLCDFVKICKKHNVPIGIVSCLSVK